MAEVGYLIQLLEVNNSVVFQGLLISAFWPVVVWEEGDCCPVRCRKIRFLYFIFPGFAKELSSGQTESFEDLLLRVTAHKELSRNTTDEFFSLLLRESHGVAKREAYVELKEICGRLLHGCTRAMFSDQVSKKLKLRLKKSFMKHGAVIVSNTSSLAEKEVKTEEIVEGKFSNISIFLSIYL